MSFQMTLDQELQVQTWEEDLQRELVERSVWAQLSNRVVSTDPLPNVDGLEDVPDSCLLDVSDKFKRGNFKTTLPWMGKLNLKMKYGRARLKGNEGNLDMKFVDVFWNNQRQAVNTGDRSVDGQASEFFKYGSESVAALRDNVIEQEDFDMQRTLLEGAPEHITLSTAWDGPTFSSAPLARQLHPNVYANGSSAKVTYDTTLNTYEGNIQTAFDALTTSQNRFGLDTIESICDLSLSVCLPLGWRTKGMKINYVALISPMHVRDLRRDSEWKELFVMADVRGDMNRAITGQIGVYREHLFLVDERSPVWNTGGSAGAYIGYKRPDTAGALWDSGDGVVTRTGKTAAGSGTVEMVRVMGKNAIGRTEVLKKRLVRDSDDYDFFNGAAMDQGVGARRLDFDRHTKTTATIKNQTSYVYATATPDVVY